MKFKIINIFLLFSILLKSLTNYAQKVETYPFPWAGGMNSVQFGEVDINLDGIKDLVVFDRQGNRLMPFINGGTANKIDYSYAPEYAGNFPKLYDWAIFKDYNNDGKVDIFTYSPGWAGMMVYKNISTSSLKFKLEVYPYLTSVYGQSEVNILVTYADYPGIADLDNDGDLDILTFWGLGSFVEMHKNMSMETYGTPDSLLYRHTETCWGKFAESDESNALFLDTCINKNCSKAPFNLKHDRHTGSTFLMLDLDNDGDKDLLLGDVDYPQINALINGGTPQEAVITEIDTVFPDGTKPVRLFSMPAAAFIDVNNDGLNDLLVAPFDPSPFISKNINNVYLYLNSGTNSSPVFTFKTSSFLQSGMIDVGSGAAPILYDYNGDGLKDLFIGNYGYYKRSYYDEHYTLHTDYKSTIKYFNNTGTNENPVFKPVDSDFGGFLLKDTTFLGLFPTLGDIDGDGKPEMISGNNYGTLILIKKADNGEVVLNYDYADIDVGEYSTPQLFDLDKDGLLDLVIGNKSGKLSYYKNEGTANAPQFTLITDTLGGVDVTDYNISWYGYSTPCFYRKSNGETVLAVGSEQGKIFLFKNIDNNLNGIFEEDSSWKELLGIESFDSNRGYRTAGSLADVDNDGYPELVTGNFSGGVEFYGSNPEVLISVKKIPEKVKKLKVFPNPAGDVLKISLNNPVENGILNVLSIDGKTLITKHITNRKGTLNLDVHNLNNGFYILKITENKSVKTTKFMVKR